MHNESHEFFPSKSGLPQSWLGSNVSGLHETRGAVCADMPCLDGSTSFIPNFQHLELSKYRYGYQSISEHPMTAMLSGNWEVFSKCFEMFPLRFIKKKGLEDSGMAGFGGKGKTLGNGWLEWTNTTKNESCCVVGICVGSLWVNIDVASGCCNGHGNLTG